MATAALPAWVLRAKMVGAQLEACWLLKRRLPGTEVQRASATYVDANVLSDCAKASAFMPICEVATGATQRVR
jgi:hypothetical protein